MFQPSKVVQDFFCPQETGLMTSLGTCLSQATVGGLWESHPTGIIEIPCLNMGRSLFLNVFDIVWIARVFQSPVHPPCEFVDESHGTWSFYHHFGHLWCRIGNPRIKPNGSCCVWFTAESVKFQILPAVFREASLSVVWERDSYTFDAGWCPTSKTGGEPAFKVWLDYSWWLDHVRSCQIMLDHHVSSPSRIMKPHRRCLASIVCWAKWRWRWSSSKRPGYWVSVPMRKTWSPPRWS